MSHENETKLQFWVDKDMLIKLDKAIDKLNYKNRSDWLRDRCRATIREANAEKSKEGVGEE